MRRMCSLRGALPLWGRRSEHREAERGFPAATENSLTTWILWYLAPSRGSCRRLKELPLRRTGTKVLQPSAPAPVEAIIDRPPVLLRLPKGRSDSPRSAPLAAKRTTSCVVRAHCVEHYPSGGAGANTAKRSGASPWQTRFPDHMDISIPGSLLAAVSAACCPPQR